MMKPQSQELCTSECLKKYILRSISELGYLEFGWTENIFFSLVLVGIRCHLANVILPIVYIV